MKPWTLDLGANIFTNSTKFKVWAPFLSSVDVKIHKKDAIIVPMNKDERGYFHAEISGIEVGDRYTYILQNKQERADPVSRFLPDGLFGPSQIIDPCLFTWTDQAWKGHSLEELIFYECHVGTFTEEGTFLGLLNQLPYLQNLGITCIELMPIAQFPGRWNWGYDGASFYSPHATYGEPQDLKALINECHRLGIAVCIDVVYNHFPPEGCFLEEFGPYLSETYRTLWGKGVNFDAAYSDEVRYFVLQNALYWISEYHIDALRLDATHAMWDFSAIPFLQQLGDAVHKIEKALNRQIHLIAENNLNSSRIIHPKKRGGDGLHAMWNDDFQHSLWVALTGETRGFYSDFQGLKDLEKVMKKSIVYDGKYSAFRKQSYGSPFYSLAPSHLVAFLENHDQIGNFDAYGKRLDAFLTLGQKKMSAFLTLLSPYLPLLFMGQEYGEEAPFQFFVDFVEDQLNANVYEGRKKEFPYLEVSEIPRPDEKAFLRSKLQRKMDPHLLGLYHRLIELRRTLPIFQILSRRHIKIYPAQKSYLAWEYQHQEFGRLGFYCDFKQTPRSVTLLSFAGETEIVLHTEQPEFGGNGAISFDPSSGILSTPGECSVLFRLS